MQDVHTCSRLGEPFTMARTRWMFGFQRRLVWRCEWLTFEPKEGCLPHTSHTAAMTRHAPCISGRRTRHEKIYRDRSRLASGRMPTRSPALERLAADDLKR